jgi:hypothetical protein
VGRFETGWLANEDNLAALADPPGAGIDRVHARRQPTTIVLDMDSSVSETHGAPSTSRGASLDGPPLFLEHVKLVGSLSHREARGLGGQQSHIRAFGSCWWRVVWRGVMSHMNPLCPITP